MSRHAIKRWTQEGEARVKRSLFSLFFSLDVFLLDQELLDLGLDGDDLSRKLPSLVGRDGRGDDGSGDTASSAESGLGGKEDVRNVLVLAEEREMEEDLNGLGV